MTNASGVYTGTVSYNWTGTVTPTLAGYTFSPANRSYTNVQANQGAQDYEVIPGALSVIPAEELRASGLRGGSFASGQ